MSTTSRELNRNSRQGSYHPSEAQTRYQKRHRNCHRPLLLKQEARKQTASALLVGREWSPEQISNRLAFAGKPTVNYNTIYRASKAGTMEPKGMQTNNRGRYPMSRHLRCKGRRGKKFAKHFEVTQRLPHVAFYFAHPFAPWKRGVNENTNDLLRQDVPQYTYKVPFSEELLREFTEKLNHRPRKCLNWKSPAEIFFSKVLHLT